MSKLEVFTARQHITLEDGQHIELKPEEVVIRGSISLPNFDKLFIYRGKPKGFDDSHSSKTFAEFQFEKGHKSITYCLENIHKSSLELILIEP